ncbi:MAG: DUF4157 domain-containing protein, partial [Flavobacteriaceae bacterium]|nr:DUF4157 domain-containing protein [Flavobacteriaceae bacterium]
MFTKTNQHTNSANSSHSHGEEGHRFIQPKLNVGKPGDQYEVEADKAADQIVAKKKQPETPFIPKAIVQKKVSEEETLQKKGAACENEGTIQKKSDQGIESNLASSKGKGSRLDTTTRTEMESGFGTDFSQVKVHTDTNAVQMSQNIRAQAFTHGNDIYFNQGNYN